MLTADEVISEVARLLYSGDEHSPEFPVEEILVNISRIIMEYRAQTDPELAAALEVMRKVTQC